MPRYYADLDNNRLLAGPLSTQIAARPVFYSGNTVSVGVDMIQRDSLQNLQNYAPASGTTVSLLLGSATTVISVASLSRSDEAGVTATATASLYSTATASGTANLYSGVTATGTASLFGNITALATATVTRGSVCTLSLSVVSVRTPSFAVGYMNYGSSATVSSSLTTSATYGFSPFGSNNADKAGSMFIEITDSGTGLYGSPQAYYAKEWTYSVNSRAELQNITSKCTFQNGKLVAINPDFISGSSEIPTNRSVNLTGPITIGINPEPNVYGGDTSVVSASIFVVADPDFLKSAESVTIVSGGSGFPDGVNIPFSIPSDEDGDGRPCTGFLRAVNGTVVSVVSLSSRGSRFTATTAAGKASVVTPSYKISSISVTCAGAGYWGAAPAVVIDDTYYDSAVAGASQAAASSVTVPGGQITLQLNSAGYGYTTAPAIRIAAPRLSDGVRAVSLTNTPTGYAPGTYACTVSGPATGVTASVNLVVTSGGSAFVVADAGSGYTSVPTVAAPAPNLTGSIQSVTIACAGFGYTSAPTVTFTGSGTGAAGTAVIANGLVTGVNVTTWGSGYSGTVTVSFASPANQGRVQSVTIVTAGTNYLSAPTVSFSGGGGSGAAASTLISNGSVTTILLSSGGSGYTVAPSVVLSASPSRTVFSGVLTVTTAFYSAASAASNLLQVNLVTTLGTTTVLQTSAQLSASL